MTSNLKKCFFLLVALFIVACKNEKKNETVATDAEVVKETPKMATKYVVDSANSIIEWVGKKTGGQHTGTINITEGKITKNNDELQSGSFTIDMKSIQVTDLEGDSKTDLEAHLKGNAKDTEDHFFNVAKFPKATFEITGSSTENGKSFLKGNLTIKGIKKNISFPVTTSTEGNKFKLTSEAFTIDRTEWGINYKSKSIFTDLGDKFINDDIELKISVIANKT